MKPPVARRTMFFPLKNRLYFNPKETPQTFHEFLIHLLGFYLGKDWYKHQRAGSVGRRHPLAKWYASLCDLQRRNMTEGNRVGDVWTVEPTGDALCLLAAAYDLYCLVDAGVDVQPMVQRLRKLSYFQGARYELAVGAILARCGWKVEPLTDLSSKHADFLATAGLTAIEVEAKSRHRRGVLAEGGKFDPAKSLRGDVDKLLSEGMGQTTGANPAVIFIDVNALQGTDLLAVQWFEDIRKILAGRPTPEPACPDRFSLIVATNYSWHYSGKASPQSASYLVVRSLFPRHELATELIATLDASLASYGKVPPNQPVRVID